MTPLDFFKRALKYLIKDHLYILQDSQRPRCNVKEYEQSIVIFDAAKSCVTHSPSSFLGYGERERDGISKPKKNENLPLKSLRLLSLLGSLRSMLMMLCSE